MSLSGDRKLIRCDGLSCREVTYPPVGLRSLLTSPREGKTLTGWLFVQQRGGTRHFCPDCARGFVSENIDNPMDVKLQNRSAVGLKKIGVLTSGGDAPGMNAAVRSVTRTAISLGAQVVGIRRGYAGLMEGDFVPLDARSVAGKIELGGTFLESARCHEFKTCAGQQQALRTLEANAIAGLIVIGGNGSQAGAEALSSLGFPVNGVASTIDNDLYGSEMSVGVDTAINTAVEAIDKLRTTATSHQRLFIVEVMGRDCGYLALTVGIAGGAEVIVTPEADMAPEAVVERIREARKLGKRHAMIVVAEGCCNRAQQLYDALERDPDAGFEPRLTVLGYIQRGARPTAFDRLLATRLGSRATELLLDGVNGCLIGLQNGSATPIPYADVINRHKPLPPELLNLVNTMSI